jgi:signal transduction histidine kinase
VIWERLSRLGPKWLAWGPVLVLQPIYLGWALRHHPGAIPVTLLATLPLGFRRRYPLGVLAVVAAGTLIIAASYDSNVPPALWVAVGTVAAVLPRRTSLVATFATLAAFWVVMPLNGQTRELLGTTISVLAVWLIGETVRTRRVFVAAELEDRAKRAAADEQARIARELHDVLAHNVSVMVVQAAAARDVFDAQPQRAREALRAIEETGRSALTELRQLLAGVRAEFEPQPGLVGLGPLVEGLRAAGLPVEVHVDGDLGDLPAGLDLSAYRIVQEALTNTLKHANASAAEVRITRTPNAVDLEVLDDGATTPSPNGGHGLIGMRERAGLVGGRVEAGPRPGGGFRVHATLPL